MEEVVKFQRSGDAELADKHLVKALGEIRQAEEQHPDPEGRDRIRMIRKEIEAAIAAGRPAPDVSAKLEEEALAAIRLLRERPDLCPTCSLELAGGAEHE
jgi:hypothetical protein